MLCDDEAPLLGGDGDLDALVYAGAGVDFALLGHATCVAEYEIYERRIRAKERLYADVECTFPGFFEDFRACRVDDDAHFADRIVILERKALFFRMRVVAAHIDASFPGGERVRSFLLETPTSEMTRARLATIEANLEAVRNVAAGRVPDVVHADVYPDASADIKRLGEASVFEHRFRMILSNIAAKARWWRDTASKRSTEAANFFPLVDVEQVALNGFGGDFALLNALQTNMVDSWRPVGHVFTVPEHVRLVETVGRWYELLGAVRVIGSKTVKAALFAWLERAQLRIGAYAANGVAAKRDRVAFEADFGKEGDEMEA